MKTKKTLWLGVLLVAIFCSFTGMAQQRITVSGTISDAETGQPLPGVTILEQGTTNGASADFDGNYTIDVDSNAVLVFSSIGYATQNVPVSGKTQIDISMAVDSQQLDEVVIVGYGSQSSRKVTGSVQQVDSEEIADIPVPQLSQKLQGRITGVQITQNTYPRTRDDGQGQGCRFNFRRK